MHQQHTHQTTPLLKHLYKITVLCDGVKSPANMGGLFRLCDAFGVEKLVFSSLIDINSSRLKRTARNTEKNIPYRSNVNLSEEIFNLKKIGYQIIGLEITSKSIPIEQLALATPKKVALVVGNEKGGISSEILQLLDIGVHISMFGSNSSMNVAQATAIALFQMTKS